jgi:hypothetical protein
MFAVRRTGMIRVSLLLSVGLLAACAAQKDARVSPLPEEQCLAAPERERLLALDQRDFDQDLADGGGGWRAVADKHGCAISAANLIRDYRERHSLVEPIIYWHEGQMRAEGNEYAAAILLFEKSRPPKGQGNTGWNQYVDASIAFLKRDKSALIQARDSLSRVKAPPGVTLTDGVFEIPNNSGKPLKMRWPPNIDVVDGLIKCYERSYHEAYGDARCRTAPPK